MRGGAGGGEAVEEREEGGHVYAAGGVGGGRELHVVLYWRDVRAFFNSFSLCLVIN